MIVCSLIRTCAKTVLHLRGHFQKQMRSHIYDIASLTPGSCCLILKLGHSRTRYSHISVPRKSSCFPDCCFQVFQRISCGSCVGISSNRGNYPSLTGKSSAAVGGSEETLIDLSSRNLNASVRVLLPKKCLLPNFKLHAEAVGEKGDEEECFGPSSAHSSHGKKVYTDYSVIGIPGDGRCLFRSVAHGACLLSGQPASSESLQRELADELRSRVADEFIRRRKETEWLMEGGFDTHISQIKKPHVWGGEPELLMLSHVLRMPITVYMHNKKYGGLISIAEYGQQYGKDNPIRVLYHGFGHYDALQIPRK